MSDIKIRKGQAGDVEAVSHLLKETWRATYRNIYSAEQIRDLTGRWHNPEIIQRQLGDDGSRFLVAELDDGVIAGHLLARLRADNTILLTRLYVRPDAQGRGIGKMLYQHMLSVFPDAKSIELEVEPQNTKALGFYHALGFVNTGRTNSCGGDSDIPALIMERLL